MIRVGILGYSGRMGQAIAAEIAAHEGCVLSGGVVRAVKAAAQPAGALITTKAEDVLAVSDVVIDVTLAESTPTYAKLAAQQGKALVCCTTGFPAETLDVLKHAATSIPLLYAPNTSLSLAVTRQLALLAGKLFGGFDYDVAILDEHHRMKKDAPSGAAKVLGDAIVSGSGGKKTPTYASIRAGHIVGEHEIIFTGQGETVRIHHSVTDRRIFARGALQAALWLSNKPRGFYSMDDVLGINP